MAETSGWPQKTREIHTNHFDSTVWNDVKFRDDDIIIATYAKSGTTWLQQIISQLIFNGQEGLPVADMSPWIDLRVPPKEIKFAAIEQQTHRRFLKTHLPVDALVFSPAAKYIYIGRDGRDVAWSLFNHHTNANDLWYEVINDTPGRVGPAMEQPAGPVEEYYRNWLENDGHPFWSFWENARSWWDIRDLPNVMMLHFSDLKADMPGEIERIAAFLDIPIDPANREAIIEHCSFDYMKANAATCVPMGGALWDGGPETFMHKGTNGRWSDILSTEDIAAYEAKAIAELGPECAKWFASGRR
jgi:aryl sulfotransferase